MLIALIVIILGELLIKSLTINAHSINSQRFYEELTQNYARFSQIETLDHDQVISLLNQEMGLTERTMAQVSNNWLALTKV